VAKNVKSNLVTTVSGLGGKIDSLHATKTITDYTQ